MQKRNGFTSDIFAEGNDPILQFFAAMDMMDHSSAAIAPFKAMAISQLEWTRFCSRRIRAFMHAPAELATCRTPQDVLNWQLQAWQAASDDWNEVSQKIASAWSHAAEASTEVSKPGKGSAPRSRRRPHDYIVLPGGPEASGQEGNPDDPGHETAARI